MLFTFLMNVVCEIKSQECVVNHEIGGSDSVAEKTTGLLRKILEKLSSTEDLLQEIKLKLGLKLPCPKLID